jgi:hypothetical protein
VTNKREAIAIDTDVEETGEGNWIRIMAGGEFNTVGVKPSDSATAVFFRHLSYFPAHKTHCDFFVRNFRKK